ncbi:unnamed protein product [Auanema sp. JU1783]|nr:unnamed protein product [Auanema sp. JU1783]
MRPLILLLISHYVFAQTYVTAPTSRGQVRGVQLNYGNNKNDVYYGSAQAFLGIPYAQPPTGDNRFRAPRSVDNYGTNQYDATFYRPKCPQANTGSNTNEDCLYLNVFTQQAGNASAQMAVMVFIDGDNGLTEGGCDQTQMKGTVRNLVSRGVVVVTFQYRLGALGFFSLQAAQFQANNGMLDQVMALQWVRSEIPNFGGDPNRITLCGQGDGACAVSAHTMSPLSQNLFSQAIISSGTAQSCYSADGTTSTFSNQLMPVNTVQTLQYDQGVPYSPMNGFQQPYNQQQYDQQQYNQQQYNQQQNNQQQYNPQQNNQQQYNQQPNNQQQYNQQPYNQQPYNQQQINQQQYNQQQNPSWQQTYQNPTTTPRPVPQMDQAQNAFINPSQDLAQRLCNITPEQWRSGQVGNLRACLSNYTVDFIVQTQGSRQAAWMIVRDNAFFPDSIENLQARRPAIPVIIGTVQDEDADYAFKLVADGHSGDSQNEMFNNWMVDFARKNKLNQTTSEHISNIIAPNYQISLANTSYSDPGQNTAYAGIGNANQDGHQYQPSGGFQYEQFVPSSTFSTTRTPMTTTPPMMTTTFVPQTTTRISNIRDSQTVQSLRTISTISSDSGIVSATATEIDSFVQNGAQYVHVYQFTYVSNLGKPNNQPQMNGWNPVVKGQDQVFVMMNEAVWSTGKPTKADRQMADQMGEQWTQFAKEGTINNWQPVSPTSNYNYCNLNSKPSQQTGYGAQARNVFNQQVNPIVVQAQHDQQQQQQQFQPGYYPQQDQRTAQYQPNYQQQPQQQQFQPQPQPYQQQYQPQQYQPVQYQQNNGRNIANGTYSQDGQSSTFRITFNLQDLLLPSNG